jgi:hypothetical protein
VPGGSEATNLLPYARLADELTRRGLGTAQFVTLSPRDAGNLACGAGKIPYRRLRRRSPIHHRASC